jgi:glycosyltransferase involved in cell wall biosynthesis
MISDQNIIYFGPEKWDGMWRNRHQLMSRFARTNKVLYVEPIYTVNRLLRDLKSGVSGWKRVLASCKHPRIIQTADNLYVYRPPVFVPISGRASFDRATWTLWNAVFRHHLKRLGFSSPIIWLSKPTMGGFIGRYSEKLSIYHVVDEYLAYQNMTVFERENLCLQEQALLRVVDLVIVVSKKLLDAKGVFNQSTYLIPNGVDYEAYSEALKIDKPLPVDMEGVQKPVFGYSGLISKRLDLMLLYRFALKYPRWSLVLVGEVNDQGCKEVLTRLKGLPNVHFLGVKEIREVPYYVKAFDVGIIPYKIDEETKSLSALKLYDFMSIGLPIIATNFPSVREFKNVVYIAESEDDFCHNAEKALAEDDINGAKKRRSLASENTWEHRVSMLSDVINLHLTLKSKSC